MRHVAYLCLLLLCSNVMAENTFKTQRWTTKNGTQVIFYQAKEVPILDISIAFKAGSAYEGQHYGLSALTTDLLNQGNASFSANEMADKLADTGAQYSANTSRDMAVISLKTLTESDALESALNTFELILTKPDFLPEAFAREKAQQLMAIEQSFESPSTVANETFFKALYRKHPYAHPILGTSEVVKSFMVEDVRRFYQQFFVSQNAYLVLVGAIDKSKARSISERITRHLPQGRQADDIPKAEALSEELNVDVPFPSSQTMIRLGQLGITHHNPHYFPLLVGNYILGGGALVSKLALELRAKRGLTYGVTSQFAPMPGIGPFVINYSTRTDQADKSVELTRSIVSRYAKEGPTDEELTAAKDYLTGSFPLSLASNDSIASMLLKIIFYQLPETFLDDYIKNINQVQKGQIKQAFKEEVHPEKMLLVRVGKS